MSNVIDARARFRPTRDLWSWWFDRGVYCFVHFAPPIMLAVVALWWWWAA